MEDKVALDFDDISAVENDLNAFTPDIEGNTVIASDKSTELLMKIADELSSIKNEISTLKSELAGFKAAAPTQSADDLSDSDAASESTGFFSDDDTDETIALTGDELNNILITADFTEEKNQEETEEKAEAEAPVDSPIAESAQSFEIPEQSPEPESGINLTTNLENEPDIPETLHDSFLEEPAEAPAIDLAVSHVNAQPEDTSYLECTDTIEPELDNVAIEEPELEIIDFNDEKLEEPKLDEFNIDLSDIEASLPSEQDVAIPSTDSSEAMVGEPPVSDEFSIDISPSVDSPIVATDDSVSVSDFTFDEPSSMVAEVATIDLSVEPESSAADIPSVAEETTVETGVTALPTDLKDDIKSVLSYMDQLLESLPEDKIEEFAKSEHFDVYKRLFEELGIS
jgi:hypothetical protein